MILDFFTNMQSNLSDYNNHFYINHYNYINYNINQIRFIKNNVDVISNINFSNKFKTDSKFIYEMNDFVMHTKIFYKNKLHLEYNKLHSNILNKSDILDKNELQNKKDNDKDKYHFNKLQIKLLDICNLMSESSSQDSIFIPEMSNIKWIDIEKIIDPQSNGMLLEELQINFNSLKETNRLSVNFDLDDLKNTHYQFNDVYIDSELDKVIIENLKKNFPDLRDRQLISNYSNHKILSEAVRTFLNLCPQFKNYPQRNASTNYIIKKLPDGNIAFTLLYHSHLVNSNSTLSFPFQHFGIRVQCILSTDSIPVTQYSYFLQ